MCRHLRDCVLPRMVVFAWYSPANITCLGEWRHSLKEKSVLVMEAIAQLRVDLPRVVEMKSTERIAIVDEQMAIRNI